MDENDEMRAQDDGMREAGVDRYEVARQTLLMGHALASYVPDFRARLAAMSDELGAVKQERDKLAAELKALRPKPELKPVTNPFAKRHEGRAPDRREP